MENQQLTMFKIIEAQRLRLLTLHKIIWVKVQSSPFLNTTKVGVVTLNFSENVQSSVQQKVIDLFGKENAIKSGTQQIYQEDALKNDIFRNIPNIQEKVKNEEFDIDFFAKNIHTMRTTGSHPKIWGVQQEY